MDHSFTISELGDNKYRLLAYSMTNSAFLGTNGAIVSITVISDAAITDGIKKADLKSQVFTDANGNQYNLDELAFNIEIATPVNDKLSVADITMPAEGKKQIEIANHVYELRQKAKTLQEEGKRILESAKQEVERMIMLT